MTKGNKEGLEVLFKGIALGLAVAGVGAVLTNNNWLALLFCVIAGVASLVVAKSFSTRE